MWRCQTGEDSIALEHNARVQTNITWSVYWPCQLIPPFLIPYLPYSTCRCLKKKKKKNPPFLPDCHDFVVVDNVRCRELENCHVV